MDGEVELLIAEDFVDRFGAFHFSAKGEALQLSFLPELFIALHP